MKSIALFLLNRAASLLLGELWLFIKTAVATLESASLTGAEKRQFIVEHALNRAKTLGVQISTALINLGIEAALQLIREQKP